MMTFCRKLKRIGGPELLLLLAFAVLARFVGPVIGMPPREGFIPLCSGIDIVYIAIDHGGDAAPTPAEDEKRPRGDHIPCPWLGPLLALLPLLAALLLPPSRPALPRPSPDSRFIPARPPRLFHARGPPFLPA